MRRQAYLVGIAREAFFQWNASSMQIFRSGAEPGGSLSGAFATMSRANGVLFLFRAPAIDDVDAEAPFRPDSKAG
jgi:hypothetical protein